MINMDGEVTNAVTVYAHGQAPCWTFILLLLLSFDTHGHPWK